MIGRFFEGPLMAAYGAQFGGAAPVAGFGGVANLPLSIYVACHPTLTCTQYQCHSLQIPCVTQFCTRTVFDCTVQYMTPGCQFASAACPGPVQGQAAAQGGAGAIAGSYAPHCWYSWNACPTMFGCGPHHTPGCPQFQAQAQDPAAAAAAQGGAGAIAGSYAPHCWYSWNACPTMFGCGPHHTPGCPQFQAQAQDPAAAAQAGAIAGSYAPHCWYSWNACPTMFGCGPHHTPGCPQFQVQQDPAAAAAAQGGGAAIAGSYAPHCWYSWNACPTMFGCGPHHTPGCPQFQVQQDPAAAAAAQGGGAAIAGSYAPHCWYSWNACPTMFGCGPHHTPGCPQFQVQQDPAAAAAAQGGAAAFAGSYAPHCWYSWNACPTMFGCGPHHTPACPQFR